MQVVYAFVPHAVRGGNPRENPLVLISTVQCAWCRQESSHNYSLFVTSIPQWCVYVWWSFMYTFRVVYILYSQCVSWNCILIRGHAESIPVWRNKLSPVDSAVGNGYLDPSWVRGKKKQIKNWHCPHKKNWLWERYNLEHITPQRWGMAFIFFLFIHNPSELSQPFTFKVHPPLTKCDNALCLFFNN